ncbi:MAG: hypothetical protein CME63_12730 [Halobacteriovoraceae bacterium]|nr:hypothetical protein [Halobacteriovoraceae bacterium]|tara:strand:+ start:9955 stop:10653 length:699 start_codon:yes stop_codon:yes gene_type:complete
MICPVCKNEVDGFIITGHVIPRFLFKKIKSGGRYSSLTKEKIKHGQQRDLKGKLWCSECELLFKKDDDAAKYFYDQSQPLETYHGEISNNTVRKYKKQDIYNLMQFIVSVAIRFHIYEKSHGNNFIEKYYDYFLNTWKSESVQHNLIIGGYRISSEFPAIIPPRINSFNNSSLIEMTLYNHSFFIKLKKDGFSNDETLAKYFSDGLILEVNYEETYEFKSFLEIIKTKKFID